MTLYATAKRVIAKCGAVYTVQRRTIGAGSNAWTAGSTSTSFAACQARERGFLPKEIRGGIKEGDVEITIDAASISGGAPVIGDRIALGTFTSDTGANWLQIVNVESPSEKGVAVLHKCQARR